MSSRNSDMNGQQQENPHTPTFSLAPVPAAFHQPDATEPPMPTANINGPGTTSMLQGGSAGQPSAQPNGSFPSQGAFLAMMAMMQHMQQHNIPPQIPSPYPQPPLVPPDMQHAPTPQESDDNTLAQVLFEQTAKGFTYKAALESLHGHRNIAAFAWKDYYLENKPRIDAIVVAIRARNLPTLAIKTERESSSSVLNGDTHVRKKARRSETPVKSESSDTKPSKKPRASSSTPALKTKVVKVKEEISVDSGRASSSSRRRTMNSMASTPGFGFLSTVPPGVAIDAEIGLPAAPSRSPSPPIPDPENTTARGAQRFTEADARFFFKRIAYDLARNPDLTKADLCEILSEKAPYHTALSWRTYWARHEDVADKMLLLTELDDIDREETIRSWKTGASVAGPLKGSTVTTAKQKRVNYVENSGSDSSKDGDSDQENSQEDGDSIGDTEEDEELGEAGSSFTNAEMRVIAKFIATKPGWLKKGHRDWGDFFGLYPQRSAASWREYYRRKQTDIDSLARKYARRAKEQEEVVTKQRGRPSWARKGSISEGKRKHEEEGKW